jgi:hypothetical protein
MLPEPRLHKPQGQLPTVSQISSSSRTTQPISLVSLQSRNCSFITSSITLCQQHQAPESSATILLLLLPLLRCSRPLPFWQQQPTQHVACREAASW